MSEYVNLRYVSSRGEEFQFQESTIVKTKSANFHAYNWLPQLFDKIYGADVQLIKREPTYYDVELRVRGTVDERVAFLEAFHYAADLDVATGKAGRLYWKGMYIECFVITSSTYPAQEGYTTVNDVEFFCPYPSWMFNRTYSRTSRSVADVAALTGEDESTIIQSDGVFPVEEPCLPSRWKLYLFTLPTGGGDSGYVQIKTSGVTTIEIKNSAYMEDYVLIDAVDKTVTLKKSGFPDVDFIKYIYFVENPFQKIEPYTTDGIQIVDNNGNNVDGILTVFFERSEPLWI